MAERPKALSILELLGPISGMLASVLAVVVVVPFLRRAAEETEALLPWIIRVFLDHSVWVAVWALGLGTISIVIIRRSPRRTVRITCSIVSSIALFVPLFLFVVGFCVGVLILYKMKIKNNSVRNIVPNT